MVIYPRPARSGRWQPEGVKGAGEAPEEGQGRRRRTQRWTERWSVGRSTNGAGAETARQATSGPTAHVVRSMAGEVVVHPSVPLVGAMCDVRCARWCAVREAGQMRDVRADGGITHPEAHRRAAVAAAPLMRSRDGGACGHCPSASTTKGQPALEGSRRRLPSLVTCVASSAVAPATDRT